MKIWDYGGKAGNLFLGNTVLVSDPMSWPGILF